MTPLGIVLLLAGILLVVASFFVPDKGDREDKKDIARKQEQIRKLLDTELDGMKLRVNEATNETVESSMEKSERALEKITNDKIMAVSEYATTVMEEIDRNHKEVMFLYDMLNDKQTDIKNTVRHAEATVKEVNEAAKTASDTAIYATNVANAANEAATQASEVVSSIPAIEPVREQIPEQYAQIPDSATVNTVDTEVKVETPQSVFSMLADMEDMSMESMVSDSEPVLTKVAPVAPVAEEPQEELSEFELLERSTSFNNVNNNNQMILKMNAEGIPVIDIARQLSLGVGEVQLVIDLFK